MLYYLGKGTEFKKENCKEYKTIKNVLIAASKDKNLCVWDETGKLIGELTDNIPEEALTTKLDGSVPYDENGYQAGTVDTATVKKVTETLKGATDEQNEIGTKCTTETETCEDEANTESQNEIIIPQEITKVTVVCDGTLNYDENGYQAGTVDTATVKKVTETLKGATDEQNEIGTKCTTETETCEDEANTESQNEIIIPQEITKVTVVCDGTLNLRRSADWGNGNICGRASKGQSYYVKAIHTVQGKKMVQTIDDIYLSGQLEHVKFEQM